MNVTDQLSAERWKEVIGNLPGRFCISIEEGELKVHYRVGNGRFAATTLVCSHYIYGIAVGAFAEEQSVVHLVKTSIANFQRDLESPKKGKGNGKKTR